MKEVSARRKKGEGKGGQAPTKFDRELKNLEWNVKDKGRKKGVVPGRGLVFSIWFLMKLRILSWNVRGANGATKRNLLKAFIKL